MHRPSRLSSTTSQHSISVCSVLQVQTGDLSSFQTTSFHTHLSFLDEEPDESLLAEEDEEDIDEESCQRTGRRRPETLISMADINTLL
ncbi:hypothetical protein NHX12_004298 [Muraenolepis orangiensis]|uniref:Uncharacterized protein n=1 Tax=Muraenolepis orangiensis TaxID=630683 RepID=A0A9Q0DWS2_9TELE|nr:hypothetical protein NHX12_004298 [Muraenolepis orangiensis]